jgi:hypothetical protein
MRRIEMTGIKNGIVIDDPKILGIAQRVLHTLQLSFDKAVAHKENPTLYPVPSDTACFEQVILTFLNKISAPKQALIKSKVMERLQASKEQRKTLIGDLAEINVKFPAGIQSQAHNLPIPDQLRIDADYLKGCIISGNKLIYRTTNRRLINRASLVARVPRINTNNFVEAVRENTTSSEIIRNVALAGSIVASKSWEETIREALSGAYQTTVHFETVLEQGKYEINVKYSQLSPSVRYELGEPVGDAQFAAYGGVKKDFKNGVILWSSTTGAHVLYKAIYEKWINLGAGRSFLGHPIMDISVAGITGVANPPNRPGLYCYFEKGAIYWYESTGAHEVHGAILEKYLVLRQL